MSERRSKQETLPVPPAPPASEGDFALLIELTGAIVAAAETLLAALEKQTDPEEAWQSIRELEHKGDAVARDMDEPASALDPASTLRIEELARELAEDVTIVIVTHNMQQAARVSEQTGFFLDGELSRVWPHAADLHEPEG